MKNTIKYSLLIPAFALSLSLTSCEDWTETESLPIVTPQVDQTEYIANLNAYKAAEHKVTFVTLDNKMFPQNQAQHLVSLPDSIDFISMKNPSEINDAIQKEMTTVRKKGTKVIYDVNFPSIEAEWKHIVKEDVTGTLTEEDGLKYFAEQLAAQFALCDEFGYDGVTLTYRGVTIGSLTEAKKAVYAARQQTVVDAANAWLAAHPNHHFTFVGAPQNLLDENKSLLQECDYIALLTENALNLEEVSIIALDAVKNEGVPSDRIIVRAMTTRPTDKDMVFGYLNTVDETGTKIRSIYGCACWNAQVSTTSFKRAGLMILDAENDYFDTKMVFPHIREAISVMNPHF